MGYATISEVNYGSEISLIYLAKELEKYYDVYIFSSNCQKDEVIEGELKFKKSAYFEEFSKNNVIDVIIIYRYLNVFLDNTLKANKIFLWVHDLTFQSFWNGHSLRDSGKHLYNNIAHRIDGVVVLSNYHKQLVMNTYNILSEKVHVIYHGINDTKQVNLEKTKYKFIYTSYPSRGLDFLLKMFPKIKEEFPESELEIYRDIKTFTEEQLKEIEKYDYIHNMGYQPNEKIKEAFQSSSVWLYPTNFLETFCMSALEAQMSGCLCITSSLGSLTEVIGDRGVLIENNYGSNEYIENVMKSLRIFFNSDLYDNKIRKSKEWTKNKTWENVGKEWCKLLGTDINVFKNVMLYSNWETPKYILENCFNKMSMGNNTWKDIKLVTDGDSEYDCVINHPTTDLRKNKDRTIVFMMEPETEFYNFPEWIRPIDVKFFSNHNTEWHLSWSYTELMKNSIVKTKGLSTIISITNVHNAQRQRIECIKYLDKNLNIPFDIYGRENNGYNHYIKSLPVFKKDEGIFPYKYTINSENNSQEGYFTEKIIDAILGECLCFYWGCPNISQFIDKEAYILIDITNPESVLRTVQESIKNNEWERRIHIIRREKHRILNSLQLFPRLHRIINNKTIPPIPSYVINLNKQPQKWEKCKKSLINNGFEMFERFEAIDGDTLEWGEDLQKYFVLHEDSYKYIPHKNNAGIFGCAMSHIRLWEKLASCEDEKVWMIMEDDVVPNQDFENKWTKVYNSIKDDKSWDICYLGYTFFGEKILSTDKKINENVYQLVKSENRQNCGGTFGYVITTIGAKKLLDLVRKYKIHRAIDWFMIDFYDKICAYICIPLLVHHNSEYKTMIQGVQKTIKGL